MLGIKHLLGGFDYVLFIVAMALGATNLRSLLGIVSAYTAAHSVTLLAALVGGLTVPSHLVEPLIALSIAFVALDGLLGETRRRIPAVSVFGHVHGLGFAGSLHITEGFSWDLVASALSFNVGIEIAQAALLLAVFPLFLLFRRRRHSVPILRAATVAVAAFGLYWFVERFLA